MDGELGRIEFAPYRVCQEETTLYDGREWRINYWLFRKNRIYELLSNKDLDDDDDEEAFNVYDDVPEDIWVRE